MAKTILCVDDEANLLRLYEQALAQDGYQVVLARDGDTALKQLVATPVDAVILDIRLGEQDGLALLDQMKRLRPNLPVILNSAYSTYKSDFASWLAEDYMIKSADLSELRNKIRKLLEI